MLPVLFDDFYNLFENAWPFRDFPDGCLQKVNAYIQGPISRKNEGHPIYILIKSDETHPEF